MIRRGLQILVLVGITALGAAPSFGQTPPPYWQWPHQVVVQGLPITQGSDPNGLYVNTGTLGQQGSGFIYTRYQVGGTNAVTSWKLDLKYVSVSQVRWELYLGGSYWFTVDSIADTWTSLPRTFSPVTRWDGFVATNGAVIFQAPPPVDPYEEAFPDWDSAGVKIPLGFAFGLAVWASLYAMAVPFKWVRDIANAVT